MMGTVPTGRQQYRSSHRLAAALLLGLVSTACKAFDPVKSHDLCTQPGIISANCPQCQGDTPAGNCPQCQEGDPSRCGPVTSDQPVGESDLDGDGIEEGPNEDPGQAQAGEDGSSEVPSGGRGGRDDAGGSNGPDSMQAAGQGGKAPPPDPSEEEIEDRTPGCQSDAECMRTAPVPEETPYCEPISKRCEECVTDEHCAGTMRQRCDPKSHRCEDCVSDGDCEPMACDEEQHICRQCEIDEHCADGDQCHADKFSCVDCTTDKGCAAPTPACDPNMNTCFECLVDMGEVYCLEEGIGTCDPGTLTCVDCIDESGCIGNGANETCDVENKGCVDCLHGDGCNDPDKPVCDDETNTCFECLSGSDCDTGHCSDERRCVECEANDHCRSEGASRCSSTNECAACREDSDCEHLDGKTECDGGRCVECKDDSGGACGDYACLRDSKTCSDVRKRSVDVCRECIADSVCREGMRCVPLGYGDRELGDFCVYTGNSTSECARRRPYSRYMRSTSIDDVGGGYCFPPVTTTCQGVIDATRHSGCTGAGECGADGVEDGDCNEDRNCTYGCSSEMDCPDGTTCLMNNNCG